MIIKLISMNGYGIYVWSAFSFTILSFIGLYLVTKLQLIKQQSRFVEKFSLLSGEKATIAKRQNINQEILVNTLVSKI